MTPPQEEWEKKFDERCEKRWNFRDYPDEALEKVKSFIRSEAV